MFILIIILILYLFLFFSSRKSYPVDYGYSFSKEHAEYLGLDWKKTYLQMLQDLKPKYLRLSAAWSNLEKTPDKFNFSDLDFMMSEANKIGTKVTLVVGQKAPRWPECHVPAWVNDFSKNDYEKSLKNYLEKTVNHYKDHPALEYWQVENEAFINFKFGDCEKFRQDLVYDEIKLVNYLDPVHWTIVTDSGEMGLWSKAGKAGDLFGTTLYRIVRTSNGFILSYDWLPAAFYRYKAKIMGIHLESMFVSELQAEPWFTGDGPDKTPIEEQLKTMNIKRLEKHFNFVEKIGVSRAYLWGVEWWYWMAEKHGDESYVDYAKEFMKK
ncbi:MAG: beta-galactosidase [Candidatus Magasanikbacteria bacterium]